MITKYEVMEQIAHDNGVSLHISSMLPDKLSGLYYYNSKEDLTAIALSAKLETTAQKTCVMAEEIEHFFTTPINLLNASPRNQEKYEYIAKWGAVKRLIPPQCLIEAKHAGASNSYEMAEYLDVTEEFLMMALKMYQEHYGLEFYYKGYIIKLNPLNVYTI